MKSEIRIHIDAKGLNCPVPLMRTRKALLQMEAGDVVSLETTDPGSVKDVTSFCSQTGNELLLFTENSNGFLFHIRKL